MTRLLALVGYLDPFVDFNNPKYIPESDIWSVGIVLHELMYGFNSYQMKHTINYNDGRYSPNLISILKQCLLEDLDLR